MRHSTGGYPLTQEQLAWNAIKTAHENTLIAGDLERALGLAEAMRLIREVAPEMAWDEHGSIPEGACLAG